MRFALFLLFVSTWSLAQQQDFSNVEIETVKVSDNIHMLVGRGGNIGVVSGEDGVFMIDDQFAPLTEKIKKAVSAITPKSVRFVLNTHWHFDHTGGNENFAKAEAVIVAHENVRKRMSKGQFMSDFNMQVDPAPKIALPVVTFTSDMTFHMNGEEIHVFHVRHAHTDGDAIVHFKNTNALHMGDVFFNGSYPYIDVGSGGSVAGAIKAIDKVLGMIDDNTKIIPGHGPLSNKSELQMTRDMLAGIHEAVKKMVDAGKSLEEVQAAKPTAPWDEKWGKGFINGDRIAGIVFNSIKNK
ncbi:MAG: MBL fold metallo-hydrolase [Acidobacteriota bacterium]|nr:MBL fold metallo-hydrolase [Acidobacteriota bacterium]